jgi:alpha-tubulin suppressor-like RCC1 family protein
VLLADGVTPLDGITYLDVGDRHSCAVRFDGTVWCWGTNGSAELAQDSETSLSSHRALQVTRRWAGMAYEVSTGGGHACVRADGGAVWCWGSNSFGQNGTGLGFTIRAEPLLAPVR